MSNIIGLTVATTSKECVVMSNQGTDCFLDLLIIASNVFEQTENQEKMIVFLKDRRTINDIAPGTAGFDLSDMPWQEETLKDDVNFLLRVTAAAQSESIFKKLPYKANGEIVIPWLKQFAMLIEQIITDSEL